LPSISESEQHRRPAKDGRKAVKQENEEKERRKK
jgi:hypothetical protein